MRWLPLILCLICFPLGAAETTIRALALEQFPGRVRMSLGKKLSDLRPLFKDVPSNKQREDERGLFLNLLGINYDVTLGQQGGSVTWMALKAPPRHAPGLYERLQEQYGKDPRMTTKLVESGGPAAGQYLELSFAREGVMFRFQAASKDLYSVVVRGKP